MVSAGALKPLDRFQSDVNQNANDPEHNKITGSDPAVFDKFKTGSKDLYDAAQALKNAPPIFLIKS
jgi:hypothetical protein